MLVSAVVLWLAQWVRHEYRDFCELRRWAIAVMAETNKVRQAQADSQGVGRIAACAK